MNLNWIIVVLMIGSAIAGGYWTKRSFASDARSLAYYEKNMLRKQGSSVGFGSYELLSFDGGKQWYAVERGPNGDVIIKGTAEGVFPGLLGHLEGINALVEYVHKNGPLTFSGERSGTDRKVLEGAGFKVVTKP